MNQFNLFDAAFLGDESSVRGRRSGSVIWDRTLKDETKPLFFTDDLVTEVENFSSYFGPKYAWTIESRGIRKWPFLWLEKNHAKFESVFTHDKRLLDAIPNGQFSPGGGVWIGGQYAGGKVGLHPKANLVSMVTSKKIYNSQHLLRRSIAKRLEIGRSLNVNTWIDSTIVASWPALGGYQFNIAMENYIGPHYFTEKLLNCFATGTVPIYRGATQVGDFFDERGVIQFRTWKQLKQILSDLNETSYSKFLPYVEENYNRVQSFLTIEDYLSRAYFRNLS